MLLLGWIYFTFMGFSEGRFCGELFSQPTTTSVQFSQERKLNFKNVEVFRRNNKMGQQQVGDITLERWIEIEPFLENATNIVGITSDGRIYHIISWLGERRVARLLSGQREFQDIILVQNQHLLARDMNGQIYLYSAQRWARSPRADVLKRGAAMWSGLSFLITSGLYIFNPDAVQWNAYLFSLPIPLPAVFTSVAAGLQTTFLMLNRYDHLNTFPDGFINTGKRAADREELLSEVEMLSRDLLQQGFLDSSFEVPLLNSVEPSMPSAATEGIR